MECHPQGIAATESIRTFRWMNSSRSILRKSFVKITVQPALGGEHRAKSRFDAHHVLVGFGPRTISLCFIDPGRDSFARFFGVMRMTDRLAQAAVQLRAGENDL